MGSGVRRGRRNRAQRLRLAVEALPPRTRVAMLKAIDSTPIVTGAYVDRESGGVCPMLGAHRNGGRTSLASFARAWDGYTEARRPRLATRRELHTLRALLVSSLPDSHPGAPGSIAEAAAVIRAERDVVARRQRQGDAAIGHLLAAVERHLADRGAFERPLESPDAPEPLSERSAAHLR